MTGTLSRLVAGYWSGGASTLDLGAARLSYRPGLETEPSATFLHGVRPADAGELDSVLHRAEAITGEPCPQVYLDPGTPVWVEAMLVARDWEIVSTLYLVLPAHADVPRPDVTGVRPAEPGDWEELAALFRADHEEEDLKLGRPIRSVAATERLVAARRLLPEPVRWFVADVGGIAGFVAGWPGQNGVGFVEDVYVRPDRRGRRLATALIAHAVGWAREGDAGRVVIGAEPNDTPKHLYARLGFAPTEIVRSALRPRPGP